MDVLVASITAVTALLGLTHAVYVYRQEVREFRRMLAERPLAIRARASYYAVWTLFLWTILGASVVAYWLIAVIPYLLSRAVSGRTKPA